jgi:hypothetical protein
MRKETIHTISSTLKTVASEQLVTAEELNQEDKSLKEILDEQREENTEQSERE